MTSNLFNTETLDKFTDELFALAKTATKESEMPYASLLIDVCTGVVLAKDFNRSRITFDPTDQCSISAIRKLQSALEVNGLPHVGLFSFFEPTIMSFDIALFAKIKNFAWCIDAKSATSHYSMLDYTSLDYAKNNPGELNIVSSFKQNDALKHLESLNLPTYPK